MAKLRQNNELANFNVNNFIEMFEEEVESRVIFIYDNYQVELYGLVEKVKGEWKFNESSGYVLADDGETIIRDLTEEESKELARFADYELEDNPDFFQETKAFDSLAFEDIML
ncbi:hypothetical protein [Ornithobacterium rhinotracheale]|uniref:hypothetical protein n=1 Tax=Ornithobacterium rhinotracheale TaxID=28251 RepID=UPI001FF48572|nr:hypothetical protein [Ornithobacterium rhinotracheale]MCK0201391.1 hypothetical protein [Ornithobacterium rhinotracheale]